LVRKKTTAKKSIPKRKKSNVKSNLASYFLAIFCILFLFGIGFHYRNGFLYLLGFKSNKVIESKESKRFADLRNFQVLSKYSVNVVGIDVSQYQGKIQWEKVKFIENNFPIQFVFIRATAGKDKLDSQFKSNWTESKSHAKIRGAYHYYRPNENSIAQAKFFIKNVSLKKGDLPPILDIESMPKNQSIDSLKVGLRRWLETVDAYYQIKPIIYTNEKFYEDFLKEEFSEYQFWIANYNFFVETMKDDWLFWQFTEKATVTGIQGNVDVNIYNGTPKMLQYLTLQ
jgi:lysozyme